MLLLPQEHTATQYFCLPWWNQLGLLALLSLHSELMLCWLDIHNFQDYNQPIGCRRHCCSLTKSIPLLTTPSSPLAGNHLPLGRQFLDWNLAIPYCLNIWPCLAKKPLQPGLNSHSMVATELDCSQPRLLQTQPFLVPTPTSGSRCHKRRLDSQNPTNISADILEEAIPILFPWYWQPCICEACSPGISSPSLFC